MTYTPPSQITVRAQPYLNLRREPAIRPDSIITRLSDGSTWPVVGVARDGFNPQSNVMWAQVVYVDPATGQRMAGFCRGDFFEPRVDLLPPAQVVLPEDGLNLRSSPIFDPAVNNRILKMPAGSRVRVLGGAWERLDPASGKWWFDVDFNGQRGYAYARYLGDPAPVEGTTEGEMLALLASGRPSPVWRFPVCLAGVGNSDPNVWQEPTFPDAINAARLEALKIIPLGDSSKMSRVYNWLRQRHTAFVMVRLYWKPEAAWAALPPAERMAKSVKSFLDGARGQLELAYDSGVRYFEVHNEPNITLNPTDPIGDGLGTAWLGPAEFAEWFSRVTDELRRVRDGIYLGFPGLAPRGTDFAEFGGGYIRVDGQPLLWNTDRWLSMCKSTIDEKADWVGVHCYWQFDGAGQYGIENAESGGRYWRGYRTKFPNKLLFITEFSNNSGQAPHVIKGRQYGQYIAMLRSERAIGAAFAFALHWQDDPNAEGWVTVDEQGRFRVGQIPGAMGAALAANASTAERVTADSTVVWA